MNDDWNKMDFFVVISSWLNVVVEVTGIQLGVSMSSLRALRIMRVLKAFKSIEGIRVILATIAAAIPHTTNVVGFLAFMFVVSGIIGVQMFRGLTRHRCEFSSFDLMGQLGEDRFPMVDYGELGPWDTANETGYTSQIEVGAATIVGQPAPGPFPSSVDPSYEYPIGIGVWSTYCNLDSDCPLYNARDKWNRTQTCQPSLNPGKTFSNYDSAPEAWITIFINMACLYWWETAHRFADANSGHDPFCVGTPENLDLYPTCEGAFWEATDGDPSSGTFLDCPDGCRYRPGGPGSAIAWVFGAFNVFMLTMVTVNMFVAAVTTIFMDQRSTTNPDGAAAAPPRTPKQVKQDEKAAAWTQPFYFVAACGGEGPYVEPKRAELGEIKGVLAEAEAEEAKWPGSRAKDIPKIQLMIDGKLLEITAANGSGRTEDGALPPEVRTGIINQPWFDQFILGFIMLNTVALASEHHDRTQCIPMQLSAFEEWGHVGREPSLHGMSEDGSELCQSPDFISQMKIANYIFNFVFTVECMLKILGMGFREYIRVAFNKLDFFIVVTSTLDMIGEALADPGEASGGGVFKLFRVFRLFRVLRVARILYRNENLKRVLVTVFGSGESLVNLTLFIAFSILLFSILGMHLLSGNYTPVNITPASTYGINNGTLWGRLMGNGDYDVRKEVAEVRYGYNVDEFIGKGLIPRRNFEDFPRAFLLSFQIMTGDDWVNQLHDYLEVRPGWITWFIFFANFGFCNFILLSLFIAVILENFEVAEAEKMKLQANMRETKIRKAEENAKKPKIFFPHRLVWLCGGTKAGKREKSLCGIGPDVEVYVSEPFDLNDEKNGMLVAGDKWYNDDKSMFAFGPDHPTRKIMSALANNFIFDNIVLSAIIIGTILLAVEGPPGSLPPETLFLFDRINDILFLVFLAEFGAKVIGYGFIFTPQSYLKNMWNRLDFVVIVGTILNYLGFNAGFVRLLRCLRPLRIINRNEGMRVIISAVIDSLAVNVGVLALSGLGLLIFGILGVSLFAGKMWSCNCSHVYPEGVTPSTAIFGDDGGWLNITARVDQIDASCSGVATNQVSTPDCANVPAFVADPTAANCPEGCVFTELVPAVEPLYNTTLPLPVETEQMCVGTNQQGGFYGIDPSLPDAISQCYWDNRPYNFDHVGNAMMALFTASTLAGWTDIMEIGMDQTGIGYQPAPFASAGFAIYFMFYVLIMAFFVTNLFIGVLIDFIGTNDGSALLTEDQQKMGDTMKFAKLHRPELVATAPPNPIRKWCWGLVESKCWELLSNAAIVFNVVVMMCEYEDQSEEWWLALEFLNLVCLAFFTVEMWFKIIAYFPVEYIKDRWNQFDFVVVNLSIAGLIFGFQAQAIRAMRAIRIVVVLKGAKGIRSLFQTLALSVAPGVNISVLLFLLYAVYAILGMMYFGNTPMQDVECMVEQHQGNVGKYFVKESVADYCKIGMATETCTASVNPFYALGWGEELVDPNVNCTDGYIKGTSDNPSTTCKAGCTLVVSTYVDRSTWFSNFAKGRPGQVLMGANRQYTHHANFHSFPSALQLLFQCATGQDWKFVMYAVGGEPGQPGGDAATAFIYFGTFFFFSNYILLNLFVAVILDNFSASMRESELNVSEEDFVDFKFKFRKKTTDEQPEMLLFIDLFSLLEDIGGDETPNSKGEVTGLNAMAPPRWTYWSQDNDMAWALHCESGVSPPDLKGFLKGVYTAANSPFKLEGQPGISFNEWYNTLLETPAIFESARQGDTGTLEDWETFRQNLKSKSSPTRSPPYAVIKEACKSLRFNVHYQHLVDELGFHGAEYTGEGSELKYDQVLQGLVNVEMGEAALSLEEQLHRG